MSDQLLAIESFIRARLLELGLNEEQLLHRLGYRNIRKGRDHLAQVFAGHFDRRMLVQRLPEALELPAGVVRSVIVETGRQIRGNQDAAYRATFQPHAVVLTEQTVPQPIFIAAFIGVARLLRIDFDLATTPDTFLAQALEGLIEKLLEFNPRLRDAGLASEVVRHRGEIPAFGAPTGIIINYSPDSAARYDLDGNLIEKLDRAKRLGSTGYSVSGRPLSEAELDLLFRPVKVSV